MSEVNIRLWILKWDYQSLKHQEVHLQQQRITSNLLRWIFLVLHTMQLNCTQEKEREEIRWMTLGLFLFYFKYIIIKTHQMNVKSHYTHTFVSFLFNCRIKPDITNMFQDKRQFEDTLYQQDSLLTVIQWMNKLNKYKQSMLILRENVLLVIMNIIYSQQKQYDFIVIDALWMIIQDKNIILYCRSCCFTHYTRDLCVFEQILVNTIFHSKLD